MARFKIKTKLFVGFGFLFVMIVLLSLFSTFYIYNFSARSAAMLKENYQSIEIAKYLSQTLHEIRNMQTTYFFSSQNFMDDSLYGQKNKLFLKYLADEENNITEIGEKEAVQQLRKSYHTYATLFQNARTGSMVNKEIFFMDIMPAYNEVLNEIIGISDVNMNGIIRKNNALKDMAHKAYIVISIFGTASLIISISFLFNFPMGIADPIRELTQGIKEIANKNYNQQLYFKSNDEFGELAEAFNIMAEKLNEYEHSNLSNLLFEKKRIETIISNMKDAIIGLDENKKIIFSNPLACELLGMMPDDLIGKYAPDVAAQNDLLQNIIKDMMVPSSNGEKKEYKPVKIYADGKVSYFSKDILNVTLTKTGENIPMPVGQVIVMKNITKFLELDEAKTNFIATISHELKTPISSIRLHLKLLENPKVGDLNDEQQKIIGTLKDETSHLLKITGELLDLTQVETGNIQLNFQAVNPVRIVDYATDALKSFAAEKNVSIVRNIPASLSFVHADLEKTAWVMINLLNNAIRYSENGGKVDIELKESGNAMIFSVKDYGIGIDAKYIDRIFDKFFTVPGSTKIGTGLGLAISREFIVNQKGSIWVESTPGEGSTFSFSLPAIHLQEQ